MFFDGGCRRVVALTIHSIHNLRRRGYLDPPYYFPRVMCRQVPTAAEVVTSPMLTHTIIVFSSARLPPFATGILKTMRGGGGGRQKDGDASVDCVRGAVGKCCTPLTQTLSRDHSKDCYHRTRSLVRITGNIFGLRSLLCRHH